MHDWDETLKKDTDHSLSSEEQFFIPFALNTSQILGEELTFLPSGDERFVVLVIDQSQLLHFFLPEKGLSHCFPYSFSSTKAFVVFCGHVCFLSKYDRYLVVLTAWVLARICSRASGEASLGDPLLCCMEECSSLRLVWCLLTTISVVLISLSSSFSTNLLLLLLVLQLPFPPCYFPTNNRGGLTGLLLLPNKRNVSNPSPEKKVAAVQSVFSVPQLVLLWIQRLVVFWSTRIKNRGVFTGKNKPIFIFAGTLSSDDGDQHQRVTFGGKIRVRRLLVSSLKRKFTESRTEDKTRGYGFFHGTLIGAPLSRRSSFLFFSEKDRGPAWRRKLSCVFFRQVVEALPRSILRQKKNQSITDQFS